MAGSILGSFVSGTRQVLVAQLFVSVGAVALAGWTFGVTNDLIRERDALNDRVIQLEQELARNDIVVPGAPVTPEPTPSEQQGGDLYPGEVDLTQTNPTEEPSPNNPPTDGGTRPATTDVANVDPAPTIDPTPEPRNPTQIFTQVFTPAPPLRTVVLHVRDREDAGPAVRIARELWADGQVNYVLDVMPPRDQRQSGYAYFDGRQNRAAAILVGQFNDYARAQEIAPWSAQLRGTALPAQGEYTADRLDIVLPDLPNAAPATPVVDPATIYRRRAS